MKKKNHTLILFFVWAGGERRTKTEKTGLGGFDGGGALVLLWCVGVSICVSSCAFARSALFTHTLTHSLMHTHTHTLALGSLTAKVGVSLVIYWSLSGNNQDTEPGTEEEEEEEEEEEVIYECFQSSKGYLQQRFKQH